MPESGMEETESGLFVVHQDDDGLATGFEEIDPDQMFAEAVRDMSDRDLMVSILMLQKSNSERLDEWELKIGNFLTADNIQRKVQEVVREFVSSGGIASLMGGGF
jgi:hypothetical protein